MNPNGQSAVVFHFKEFGHTPAFNKAKILDTERFLHRRNTIESLHILDTKTYDLRRDTASIAATYIALLDKHKQQLSNHQTVVNNRTSAQQLDLVHSATPSDFDSCLHT